MILAHRIGAHRWEAGAGLVLAAIVVVVGLFFAPWSLKQLTTIKTLRAELHSIRNIDSLTSAISATRNTALAIDSNLQVLRARRSFEEAQVVSGVYAMADSAGCARPKSSSASP
jgi:hypothetical protein